MSSAFPRSSIRSMVHQVGACCLGLSALVTFATGLQAETVWCSEFETASGTAVGHGDVADVVDNQAGAAGAALGSAPGFDPLLYVQYGQSGVPAVPSGIDPGTATGQFAISTPPTPTTGINTNIPSDAGNLGSAVTFEGYFYTPESEPITSPSYVGRRLVSQKRSANDGESRLAVGLHALVTPATGLLDYEGFSYGGTVLAGQTGGTGWGGAWDDADDDFALLTDDSTSLSVEGTFPFAPAGSRIAGGPLGANGEGVRPLSQAFSMAEEGGALYLSYLVKKTSTGVTSGNNVEVSFDDGTASMPARSGFSSDDFFFLAVAGGATTKGTTPVTIGTTYFVVVKIVASAAGDDTAQLAFFEAGGSVPAIENDVTWEVTAIGNTSNTLSRLRMVLGANAAGEFDEIRVGTSYAAVTDPNAVSTPGSFKNVLSVFWKEVSPDPQDPAAGPDHLELGSTPVLANAWHHFACTYSGTEIRWYLDGTLEGTVASPNLIEAGSARLAVGNNRISGANGTRGFFGLLDEVRIYESAVDPADLLVAGGSGATGLVWQSRFETELGQPVTHGQVAASIPNAIDSAVGPPNGTMAGIVAISYAGYSEPDVDAIGSLIDPAGLGGAFALMFPDMRIGAVNTNVPSDTGNLANAVTIQGYFNSFTSEPITDGSYVSRRFVSLKRSADDGQSRLAIGLHAYTPVIQGLLDYEGFDYTGASINTLAGGIGFDGGWLDADGNFALLSDDGVSLTSAASPFTPLGSRIVGAGGSATRLLSTPMSMAEEGNVGYVSCLIRKTSIAATAAEDIQVQFFDNANNMRFRFAVGSSEQFLVQAGGSGNTSSPAGTLEAGKTYFLVAKVVSHASVADEGFLAIFGPDDVVPTSESGITWNLQHASTTSVILDRVMLVIGAGNVGAEIDELRIGSTYEAVTDPDAPLGGVGDPYNVMAVYYNDGANQLRYGTTEILPNIWHHFGLTYDGSVVRWYLDGALEGEATATLAAPGSAMIGVGNNRTAGNGTRGFHGMLDKIVIEDAVRDPAAFMTAGIDGCGLACNRPFADMDEDGDVDQDDFAVYQRCVTIAGAAIAEGCECLDRNEDTLIDALDAAEFIKCGTGPELGWEPEMTPDCLP